MKTENKYVFMITKSGDRTNILANFKVVDYEEIKKQLQDHSKELDAKVRNKYQDVHYRYAKIGGYADNMKGMSLETFEEIFEPEELTPEIITHVFRVEVSNKYGTHKIKNATKTLSKKSLVPGGIYRDLNGDYQVFLGQLVKRYYRNGKEREDMLEFGLGWVQRPGNTNLSELTDRFRQDITCCSVIKGIRKVVELVGYYPEGFNLEVHTREYDYGFYDKTRHKTEVTFV